MTDSIKTKIANLLAKAESTDNVYEQQAFMAKVNELLERHQIAMHEIRTHKGVENDPLTRMRGDLPSSHEWPSHVGFELAWYYGAAMYRHKNIWKQWNVMGTKQHRKIEYTYSVVGRESACITFDLMFPFVLSQVRQQARAMARDTGLSIAKAERSVGMALVCRINEMRHAAKERRESNERNALVPVDDLKAFAESLFTVNKIRTPDTAVHAGADEYADKVSLHHQATAAGKLQIAAN